MIAPLATPISAKAPISVETSSGDLIRERVRTLHPAYFAMIMATGVVSLGCFFLGYAFLARALFRLNIFLYAILWILSIWRAASFTGDLLADWSDHQRGVGFFTTVAATSIIGLQFTLLLEEPWIGFGFWCIAFVLWSVIMYTLFPALTVKETKPSLDQGINGGWLTAVVATQSLCVLGCLTSGLLGPHREEALFVMLALWLVGGMLYIWMISLIFYRYTFFKFVPSDLMPPYWINMGAMAISTLAGTKLIKEAASSPLLSDMIPFLKGFTVFYWATATWWIPMLVILAFWRHVMKRFPVTYDPLYWGAVFPLGMYTTCTYQLSGAIGAPFLLVIPRCFIFIALAAWAVTFNGLLRNLVRLFRQCVRVHVGKMSFIATEV